jgi:hypothetical protein
MTAALYASAAHCLFTAFADMLTRSKKHSNFLEKNGMPVLRNRLPM